jgi:hypothetical protein
MADRGLDTQFEGRGLAGVRPLGGRGLLRSFLLATVMGIGVGASSVALAEQAPATVATAPSATAAGADASAMGPSTDAAAIITLADNTAPAKAPAAPAAQSFVLADNTAGNLVFAQATPAPAAAAPAAPTSLYNDPNWDAKLGTNPWKRFWAYQKLEWGQAGPPATPGAPPSRRADFPPQAEPSPPFPFTEWPYGGATGIATNRTASYDSPLMVALEPTGIGKWLTATGIQAYGWIDYGGNFSTSKNKGGNAPAAYLYNPNGIALDQAVLYVERTPDTVQQDHIDWGFRLSGIYGTNYRYTTSDGLASYQLFKHNYNMGYDFPMLWGELYVPKIADGLLIRVGRYISVPDIEAQLAPNNYMYTHSITYTFDNYTNEGVQFTLLANKNWTLQLGISDGTEATLWNANVKEPNLFPNNAANLSTLNSYLISQGLPGNATNANPLYGKTTFLKDPGVQPSVTACARWEADDAKNTVYLCADAHNRANWGYNNLQWQGLTVYHKWADNIHTSFEFYDEFQEHVINLNNVAASFVFNAGGTPFSPQYFKYNGPSGAQCHSVTVFSCTAQSAGAVQYTSWQPDPLDNISVRTEIYDDEEGQRTGTNAIYYDVGLGWQHWPSPQVELRPEITYYWASKAAFNSNVGDGGGVSTPLIPANKTYQLVIAADAILHF